MSTFSERYGHKGKKAIQFESMDNDLRVRLWNALDLFFWSKKGVATSGLIRMGDYFSDQPLKVVISCLWVHHLNRPIDDMPNSWGHLHREFRQTFFRFAWNEMFDAIEYMASQAEELGRGTTQRFVVYCNQVLEAEQSAYRFVGRSITPITDEVEVQEVEKALITPYDAVRHQIQSAVALLAQKPTPDLRNCIKESINMVETAARLASGNEKGTLGKLLPVLKKKLNLHPSQVEGFSKLYGYTSDDDSGIRHGMMDKDDLTADDARYMLVTCSAFANYLLRLAERAGILKPPS